MLGTHNVTRSCWQGHLCSAGQASPCLGWCWSPVFYSLGFFVGLWLTYAGCQMVFIWQKWSIQLHFNCHYECTMWIFNQVSIKELSISYRVVFSVFLITLCRRKCLSTFPLPLCIPGNRCPMGQLSASTLCFCMLLHMIIVKHIFQWLSFFVVGSHLIVSLFDPWWESSRDCHTCMTVY